MKFTLLPCLLLATVSAIGTALPHQKRLQRDVSELPGYNYLQPKVKYAQPHIDTTITAEEHAHEHAEAVANTDFEVNDEVKADGDAEGLIDPEVAPISAALGADGYEYRAFRRLKYRQRARRDVSHLSPTYLPPSRAYLSPNVDTEDTDVVNAAEPKMAPVYLPPEVEEVSTIEPIVVVEGETETPAVNEQEPVLPEVRAQQQEAPQDNGVLLNDGYHYHQPTEEMPLPKTAESEYLPPPLEQNQPEVEGPAESAVLADDGYHYRSFKRLRL